MNLLASLGARFARRSEEILAVSVIQNDSLPEIPAIHLVINRTLKFYTQLVIHNLRARLQLYGRDCSKQRTDPFPTLFARKHTDCLVRVGWQPIEKPPFVGGRRQSAQISLKFNSQDCAD